VTTLASAIGKRISKGAMTLFGFAVTCMSPNCFRREAARAKREWSGGGRSADTTVRYDSDGALGAVDSYGTGTVPRLLTLPAAASGSSWQRTGEIAERDARY
jgi:hypothetical protein